MTEGSSPDRRGAWLDIDTAAIRHNVAIIRTLVGGAAVAPVVKAGAYGHGARAVVEALAGQVEAFCVATLDEALAVRGWARERVMLLYPVPPAATAEAAAAGLELSVFSEADLEAVRRALAATPSALTTGERVGLHLCVETGFGRGGLVLPDLVRVAAAVHADARVRLAGLWSHLASPEDADVSRRQVGRFDELAGALVRSGIPVPVRHLAASGGLFAGSAPAYDLVRPGLAAYGVLEEGLPVAPGNREAAASLRPALSLKAHAIAISEIPTGERVGYGGRWRAERPSRVAVLPLGYGDGYLRGAQPGGAALVRGRRVPLVGTISMDSLAVDVTDLPDIGLEEEFVLLGRQGEEAISAGDLARARNTIAWEVLSSMAPRLARVYHP